MAVLVIDLESCIRCDICVELAPHAFQINDMAYVEVLSSADDSSPDVQEAIRNCPKDCISIE
jgi:ferredoxin